MGLQWNWLLLVLPEPSEHGPTERQREQCDELTESFSLTEMG
jgi:hypothetical protein